MPERFQLPRIKPTSKQVDFDFLYKQQQVLASIQNFARMGVMAVAELDTKFQNPTHNHKFQQVIDLLYSIITDLANHPKYIFKPESEDIALDVSGETYELNMMLAYLDTDGIRSLTDSIRAAIEDQKRIEAANQTDKI